MIFNRLIAVAATQPAARWGVMVALLLLAAPSGGYADIVNTRHNLSAWSPYVGSASADPSSPDFRRNRVCIFCHMPHNAESTQAPLWGHMSTVSTFVVISTTVGKIQPNGISRKCLGCHDGTVAVGAVFSVDGDIPVVGSSVSSGYLQPGSIGYIGTDLTTGHYNHPVSMNYSSAAYLKEQVDPGKFILPLSDYNKKVLLDGEGRVQCHSCHNPHNDGGNSHNLYLGEADAATGDPLWRKEMDCHCNNSTVCGSCHDWARDKGCPGTVYDEYYEHGILCDSLP
ncbi:MAG: hypothetical protein OEV42_06160 [Deltaproteobacteria bacterium]|nr:hypothetical protein [Deltaproteobacteria bacterium]